MFSPRDLLFLSCSWGLMRVEVCLQPCAGERRWRACARSRVRVYARRGAADVDEWLMLMKTSGLLAKKLFVKEKQGRWLLFITAEMYTPNKRRGISLGRYNRNEASQQKNQSLAAAPSVPDD